VTRVLRSIRIVVLLLRIGVRDLRCGRAEWVNGGGKEVFGSDGVL
jgi:hypothetical protein